MISVIVPIYNTEKYLNQCIKSIVNQTYKDLEIILIDDASTDTSVQIMKRWAKLDNRILCIFKSENTGVSDTRNSGLSMAKGEYITFVDSDDWIEPEMYAKLMDYIETANTDIAICGYNRITSNEMVAVLPREKSGTILNRQQTLLHCMPERPGRSPNMFIFDKLFRKSVLMVNGTICQFDAQYRYGEDVVWLVQVLLNSRKSVIWQGTGYHYRIEREGNTWTTLKSQKNLNYCKDALSANEYALRLVEPLEKRAANAIRKRVLFYREQLFKTAAAIHDKEQYHRYCKGYIQNLLKWCVNDHTAFGIAWTGIKLGKYFCFKIVHSIK